MRSRYSAYVRGEHASTLATHAKRLRYEALRVLDRDGPDADGIARVLFHVRMKQSGKDASFAELSSFASDGTGWRYVGGELRARAQPEELTIASFLRRAARK